MTYWQLFTVYASGVLLLWSPIIWDLFRKDGKR